MTTLYDYIESELIQQGFNDYVNEAGELIFFDDTATIMSKVFNYDEDVQTIVDRLFHGTSLTDREHDEHFKKNFIYRFIHREMNRQTIEAFKFELMSTFLTHQDYINRLYTDLDQYVTSTQTGESENENSGTSKSMNEQKQDTKSLSESLSDGETISNNRNATQNLPQSNINIDLNDDTLNGASENAIQKNKQLNQSTQNSNSENETTTSNETETEDENQSTMSTQNKSYRLDQLFQSMGTFDYVLNEFDRRCFKQTW